MYCSRTERSLVASGVIQESVLGPRPILLHFNGVFNVSRNGLSFPHADDIKIVCTL